MDDFVLRLPSATLVSIKGAMHNIFKETDDKRKVLWEAIDAFIAL